MVNIGLLVQTSCLWEVTARKPGNVHRYQDFSDLTYLDFALSAAAIAPVLAEAGRHRIGTTVLACIEATRRVVQTNSNLGIVLLLAPLAAAPDDGDLQAGVARVLSELDAEDARLVYDAIRLAQPGGLGEVPEQDVNRPSDTQGRSSTLWEVMKLAEERDRIARQYVTDFADVFDEAVPAVSKGIAKTGSLEGGIIHAQLQLLSRFPDSLMARKWGLGEAEEASWRAKHVLREGWPNERAGWLAYQELDGWLRTEGRRRNPGTTADLLTAALFVMLREGTLALPTSHPWPVRIGGED
jgi:triphosphoribosyl-dephospho-CoA synthase